MKTVVTIDFDILLYQDIPLYNDVVGDHENIDTMAERYPLLNNCRFDYCMYKDLTNLIMLLFDRLDKEKIHFCYSHEAVVECTNHISKFDVVNIDHHHDIAYRPPSWIEKIPDHGLRCGNWVKFLLDRNKINSYTWVQNVNSARYEPEMPSYLEPDEVLIIPNDFDQIEEKILKADEVIICASFNWIPSQYRELFFLWVDIYKAFYKINDYVEII